MSHCTGVQVLFLLMAASQLEAAVSPGDGRGRGCPWDEAAADWALARRLPAGEISGSLGRVVVPFLHQQGVPISFVSKPLEEVEIHLSIDGTATAREVLEELIRERPEYRFDVVGGKMVLFPTAEEYDSRLEIGRVREATRAVAMYFVLGELKAKHQDLQNLELPTLRGGGNKYIHGDAVEVGGDRSIVEHLVSVTGTRPAVAFRLVARS